MPRIGEGDGEEAGDLGRDVDLAVEAGEYGVWIGRQEPRFLTPHLDDQVVE